MPKISIVIPIYEMKNGAFFLWRAIQSIMSQTYKDYEIIITQEGKMAENTNAGIKKARGEIIKILYMDDYLAHNKALQGIAERFQDVEVTWLITGADDNPYPYYTDDIEKGNNKLGSPSALAFRTHHGMNVENEFILFDEKMSWLLDCDLYKRMYETYGEPSILDGVHVVIGKGDHQATYLMSDEAKLKEQEYLIKKHD